jgi:hypothetical protein
MTCFVSNVQNTRFLYLYMVIFNLYIEENFAVKKPAQQSTTTNEGIASRAVDGKKSRIYHDWSCTRTAEQTTPWWRVDLQQRITVTQVKIANREIHGDRLSGFEIRIGDSLENNGITSLRCGTRQYIPSNRVTERVRLKCGSGCGTERMRNGTDAERNGYGVKTRNGYGVKMRNGWG